MADETSASAARTAAMDAQDDANIEKASYDARVTDAQAMAYTLSQITPEQLAALTPERRAIYNGSVSFFYSTWSGATSEASLAASKYSAGVTDLAAGDSDAEDSDWDGAQTDYEAARGQFSGAADNWEHAAATLSNDVASMQAALVACGLQ